MTQAPTATGERFVFPLSYAQQRLWFLDRFEPGSAAYNLPLVVRVSGKLQRAALEQALSQLVARHETLRTTYFEQDGEPQQAVEPAGPVETIFVDLSGEVDAEAAGRELTLAEVNRPFALDADLPLRATLVRLREDEHLFIVVLHHIAADGWSLGVLFAELGELYRAALEGREPELSELPVQYADYTMWQRELLQGEYLEQQLSFWREQLAGAPSVLDLPTDRPRPAMQSDNGAHEIAHLDAALTEQLKALGQQESASLFMTLLAGVQAVLSRITGQSDIVVGTPIANRSRVELEGLIGFFANTLALRTETNGEPTFRELVRRVRAVTLDAYAHQDLPFERLVSELNPQRELSHSPVFQVLFALQNTPGRRLDLPGLTLSTVEIERGRSKWDLAIFMSERPDGMRVSIEYNTDLFDAATARRMLGWIETFLRAAAADADASIAELPILTTAERDELTAWNATAADMEIVPVTDLVERQVRATPDAVAVEGGSRTLSYAELNARANQLARRLQELGVGADVPVALCLERSPELAVAVLATLKAGGAYAPIDPAYPAKRIELMLEDLSTPVLVAHAHLAERLPATGAELVVLDPEWAELADLPDQDLERSPEGRRHAARPARQPDRVAAAQLANRAGGGADTPVRLDQLRRRFPGALLDLGLGRKARARRGGDTPRRSGAAAAARGAIGRAPLPTVCRGASPRRSLGASRRRAARTARSADRGRGTAGDACDPRSVRANRRGAREPVRADGESRDHGAHRRRPAGYVAGPAADRKADCKRPGVAARRAQPAGSRRSPR
jgi:Condensation domain/AMP-binding enzyme